MDQGQSASVQGRCRITPRDMIIRRTGRVSFTRYHSCRRLSIPFEGSRRSFTGPRRTTLSRMGNFDANFAPTKLSTKLSVFHWTSNSCSCLQLQIHDTGPRESVFTRGTGARQVSSYRAKSHAGSFFLRSATDFELWTGSSVVVKQVIMLNIEFFNFNDIDQIVVL